MLPVCLCSNWTMQLSSRPMDCRGGCVSRAIVHENRFNKICSPTCTRESFRHRSTTDVSSDPVLHQKRSRAMGLQFGTRLIPHACLPIFVCVRFVCARGRCGSKVFLSCAFQMAVPNAPRFHAAIPVEIPPRLDLPPPAKQNDAFESATGNYTEELRPSRTPNVAKRKWTDLMLGSESTQDL